MSKIIRLTENDLTRIIKRVINEDNEEDDKRFPKQRIISIEKEIFKNLGPQWLDNFIEKYKEDIINHYKDNGKPEPEIIVKFTKNMDRGEYDGLSDSSGKIVNKKDYIIRMLKDAMRNKDWEKVNNVIMFIDKKM